MLIQVIIFSSGLILGTKNKKIRRKFLSLTHKNKNLESKLSAKPRNEKKLMQVLRKVIKISVGGSQVRYQQQRKISGIGGPHQLSTAEIKLNRNIKGSIGLMGLSLIGAWFYTPLLPIAGFATLIIFAPIAKKLIQNLKKGRVTTELIETVSVLGLLASGYFFLAIAITFTSLLCQKLLMRTEQYSQRQLINSYSQKQKTIWVLEKGSEVEVNLDTVKLQDIVVVNAGEIIPVDGIIIEGEASIDQHSLTGESKPIEIEVGGKVFASTLLLSGRILIEVEKTGIDTNAAKIGLILEQTLEYKESLRLRGKEIADGFIAPTIAVSGLTLPLLGSSAAMAIIWSAFGYNMTLYGPISVLNFLHIMAKGGILIKDGRSLEMLQQIDTLVFDKTGTLTMEQPKLSQIFLLGSFDEDTLLSYAATAEYRQTHPIAKAILSAAKQRKLNLSVVEKAVYKVGYGIEVIIDKRAILVGSARFMEKQEIELPKDIQLLVKQSEAYGYSLIYIAVDGKLAGALELQPCIRSEAREIIDYVKSKGIAVYIMSGDHKKATQQLADDLNVENYYYETLPDKKAELIKELRASGKFVAYVGDGINDSIALKQANVSISLCGASTMATDTAQIILMDGNLKKLKALFEISKSFEKNMNTNYLASMVPGFITLTGVFFFNMGLIGAMGVYFTSKAFGLANAMHPLLKHEKSEINIRKPD